MPTEYVLLAAGCIIGVAITNIAVLVVLGLCRSAAAQDPESEYAQYLRELHEKQKDEWLERLR